MKKRIISLVLAVCVLFGMATVAFAENEPTLKFDENGEFKILHLADCQDGYPADTRMLAYIDAVIKEYQPDIVILGGDNTVGEEETKKEAINEIVSIFVENETYFTLVFGNHDYQQGVSDDEALKMYQECGGQYCLAYDEVPELSGTATHNLPVYSADGSKIKFNLWMFDSGDYEPMLDENGNYVYDENGNLRDIGYECVDEDQIEWYINRSNELKAETGALVPSLAFQHIVVGDVYDALFPESPVELGVLTPKYNGKVYSFFPKTDNFTGFLLEFPCPGVYNKGQFDAMVKQGDVAGIFSGHDHINSYETELDGIKIINTPGATYNSYAKEYLRGSRLITVKEDDPANFTSEVITVNDMVLINDDYAAEIGVSRIEAYINIYFAEIVLALGRMTGIFAKILL